jgi:co-chaperonin GroES (HSP10)
MPFNPRSLRPIGEWAVLVEEPRKKVLSSGLILTDKLTMVENVSEMGAEVVSIGTSKKFAMLDLMPGRRVLYRGFLKYAHPLETEERWENGDTKKFFLIKIDDIAMLLGKDVDVGCFSSRAPTVLGKSTFAADKITAHEIG